MHFLQKKLREQLSTLADIATPLGAFPLQPIGYLQSCFSQRNGTPRQPLLAANARAKLLLRCAYTLETPLPFGLDQRLCMQALAEVQTTCKLIFMAGKPYADIMQIFAVGLTYRLGAWRAWSSTRMCGCCSSSTATQTCTAYGPSAMPQTASRPKCRCPG